MAPSGTSSLRLREVRPGDLDTLFSFHRDPESNRMAAFTVDHPDDREAFDAWWRRLLGDDTVIKRTVVLGDGTVAGSVVSWVDADHRQIAYWLGREHWGRGYTTEAVARFVAEVETRPLRARVAADNVASARVLEKCGFRVVGAERGYANARGEEIDELVLEIG